MRSYKADKGRLACAFALCYELWEVLLVKNRTIAQQSFKNVFSKLIISTIVPYSVLTPLFPSFCSEFVLSLLD